MGMKAFSLAGVAQLLGFFFQVFDHFQQRLCIRDASPDDVRMIFPGKRAQTFEGQFDSLEAAAHLFQNSADGHDIFQFRRSEELQRDMHLFDINGFDSRCQLFQAGHQFFQPTRRLDGNGDKGACALIGMHHGSRGEPAEKQGVKLPISSSGSKVLSIDQSPAGAVLRFSFRQSAWEADLYF